MKPKLCKDCRFCTNNLFGELLCLHHLSTLTNEDTGSIVHFTCNTFRSNEKNCPTILRGTTINFCGPEGKYWEAKDD